MRILPSCVAISAGLLLLANELLAEEDERLFIGQYTTDQVIELQQVDHTDPQHVRSTFSLTTYVETEGDTGAKLDPVPEVTLPAGATGSFDPADFTTEGITTANFTHESTEVDGVISYPPGAYGLTFRAPDGSCVISATLTRSLDDPPFPIPYNLRTRIINRDHWRDGMLCLPKEHLIVRWETIGGGVIVFGDTEEYNEITIRDAESGAVAYEDVAGEEVGAFYPQLVLPGQQGLDLSHVDTLVSGRTYNVELEKKRLTVIVEGNTESEHTFTILTRFKLHVDPAATLPPLPKLRVSMDDQTSVFEIRWVPDLDHDYLVLPGLRSVEGADGEQVAKITAGEQVDEHIFTMPIESRREFFRVLTIPK